MEIVSTTFLSFIGWDLTRNLDHEFNNDGTVCDCLGWHQVFLALQCRKHGLTSREYDQLRRKLLSTFALGEKKGRQEAEWKEELVGSLTKDYETEIEDMYLDKDSKCTGH